MCASGVASSEHYQACHSCDWLVQIPSLGEGEVACCPRCGQPVASRPRFAQQRPLVYGITSLIMLLCANLLPFLSVSTQGVGNKILLYQAAATLFSDDFASLGMLIYLVMQLLPLCCLLLLGYGLLRLRWHGPLGLSRLALRWLFWLQPWGMVEVFMLGTLVSLIKIAALAEVEVGSGFWCYVAFSLAYLKSFMHLDRNRLWQQLVGPVPLQVEPVAPCSARELDLALCHLCHATVPLALGHCPRCQSQLHVRQPQSLQRCFALLVAAIILYVPANVLPMMVTETLGSALNSTILQGVVVLWKMGDYPVAMVIFFASIMIPIAKILALLWLCYSTYRGNPNHRRGRNRLYHLTEFVGRWSMVDVFVVAVLAALIRMGKLMSIYPGDAAVAFAAVVLITMLSAMAFDSRLIWDPPPSIQARKTE